MKLTFKVFNGRNFVGVAEVRSSAIKLITQVIDQPDIASASESPEGLTMVQIAWETENSDDR